MIRTIIIAVILSLASVAFAQDRNPNQEVSLDHVNEVYVLLAGDTQARLSVELLQNVRSSRHQEQLIPALRGTRPNAARFIMGKWPSVPEFAGAKESPRSKLGRYLVLRLPDGENLEALVTQLNADPLVEFAGINYKTSLDSCGTSLDTNPPPITVSKSYARSKLRAPQAWGYERGHTYITVIDTGISPDHEEFKQFSGSSFYGGNFVEGNSFDIGDQYKTGGSGANPHVGLAIFGDVDGYKIKKRSPASGYPPVATNCDDNSDGYNAAFAVGHGSHVSGLLAANGNSQGLKGVCKECPFNVARFVSAGTCTSGAHHDGSPKEVTLIGSELDAVASMGFAIDVGSQVLNYSGGWPYNRTGAYCTVPQNQNDPSCLVLEYAEDREVIVIASAGNQGFSHTIGWPGSDKRVVGVSGLNTSGGFWDEGQPGCASNSHNSSLYGPKFSAPAQDVYSTLYEGKTYTNTLQCDEMNDGVSDGYGYCSGTSMSAPLVSGSLGLVRSVNPLAPATDVINVAKDTSDRTSFHAEFGYGTPRTDLAVRRMLGIVNGAQVRNRAIPLFNLYSSFGKDFAVTTKPQMALSYLSNTTWKFKPYSQSANLVGYSFAESPHNSDPSGGAGAWPPTPKADAFILSTHVPVFSGASTEAVYRVNKNTSGNNSNWTLVTKSELSSFKSSGYKLDGKEGYIFKKCSNESSCKPPWAVKFYRAYHSSRKDHAVFPESMKSHMQGLGYTSSLTVLGYVFEPIDTDSDGLINGFELMIGTNLLSSDTDGDGLSDSYEYPLDRSYRSDPKG